MSGDEVERAHQLAEAWVREQDARRDRRWPRARDGKAPNPPWPDPSDAVLDHLLKRATAKLEGGESPEMVLINLAITTWFEGHIEGYDRAYAEVDGRRRR